MNAPQCCVIRTLPVFYRLIREKANRMYEYFSQEIAVRVQGTTMECGDFQIALLMERTKEEEEKEGRSISSKMPFQILSLLYTNYISYMVSVACNTYQLKECVSC